MGSEMCIRDRFKIPIPTGHIWDSFLRVFLGLVAGIIVGVPLGLFMGLNRFAKGFFDPLIELYRPVPPLAWAPLVISVLGIDNFGKVFHERGPIDSIGRSLYQLHLNRRMFRHPFS